MDIIRRNDIGAAVDDVQSKLCALGYLTEEQVTGIFDDVTIAALKQFCQDKNVNYDAASSGKIWSALLDASYQLGDRTLYLRMPFFHGNDVAELQNALSTLGFDCGDIDGIFGAHTELALRKFQTNMGLPTDGIVGAETYRSIKNLSFTWSSKPVTTHRTAYFGFSRAADVLEASPLCLFGTDDFCRSVAARMSNLAIATNPASKIVSADALSVAPDERMLLVRIALGVPPSRDTGSPWVTYDEPETLALRLRTAIGAASTIPPRITVQLPGKTWETAGEERSAQHFAITLLDALCVALLPE